MFASGSPEHPGYDERDLQSLYKATWTDVIASFYDAAKYTCVKHVESEFSDARPYHILVLKTNGTTDGIIWLNLHNGHAGGFDDIARHLSGAARQLNLDAAERGYRIVVTGDFNETGWSTRHGKKGGKMTETSWTPFSGIGVSTSVSISTYPCSCCHGDGHFDRNPDPSIGGCDGCGRSDIDWGWRGGDYIFDSQAGAQACVPSSFDTTKPQSDHLPVVATLPG